MFYVNISFHQVDIVDFSYYAFQFHFDNVESDVNTIYSRPTICEIKMLALLFYLSTILPFQFYSNVTFCPKKTGKRHMRPEPQIYM